MIHHSGQFCVCHAASVGPSMAVFHKHSAFVDHQINPVIQATQLKKHPPLYTCSLKSIHNIQ